jgi:hypothetical protein
MTAVIIDLAEYRAAKTAAATRPPQGVSADEAIAVCLARPEIITPWEAQFLVSIRQSSRRLSPKQQAVIQRILDKVCAAAEDDAS